MHACTVHTSVSLSNFRSKSELTLATVALTQHHRAPRGPRRPLPLSIVS